MSAVEDFICECDEKQRNILLYFHHLFENELNLTSKIRFKIPFYYGRSWICYMNPIKKGGVTMAFVRGNELSNSNGILESKNRKQVMSIDFDDVKDIPAELIMEVIHEAILLDETIPYASKNKSS